MKVALLHLFAFTVTLGIGVIALAVIRNSIRIYGLRAFAALLARPYSATPSRNSGHAIPRPLAVSGNRISPPVRLSDTPFISPSAQEAA